MKHIYTCLWLLMIACTTPVLAQSGGTGSGKGGVSAGNAANGEASQNIGRPSAPTSGGTGAGSSNPGYINNVDTQPTFGGSNKSILNPSDVPYLNNGNAAPHATAQIL